MSQSPADFDLHLDESASAEAVAQSAETDEKTPVQTATKVEVAVEVAATVPEPSAQAAVNKADQQRARASRLMQAVHEELEKALIGQTAVVEGALCTLIAAGHLLIEGVPGSGKTLLVRAIAQCFSGQFNRIQFTPDLMPSDITGHAVYDLHSEQFKLRKGPAFTDRKSVV